MSLQFNVSQLLMAEVGQRRTYDLELDGPMDLDDAVASGIEGSVKFTLTNFGILAAVKAHADVHLMCARCLEPFQTPMDVAFQEEFRPVIDVATGLPAKMPESDTAFQISPNHTVDLEEAIRQQLLLAIEIIPVCRDNCRGLCPTCGTNLNTATCDCEPPLANNAFAVLSGLFAEVDGQ
jgi:uncharacterized protein